MAGITTRLDDFLSGIAKRFGGKRSQQEITIPHEISPHRKAIELAQDFGFITEEQTGLLMTARDIARGLASQEIMGVPEGQASEALKMLYGAIENSGPLFGRKDAEKAGLALGMALAATLNEKADKRLHEAKDFANKAEEMKAAGKVETAAAYTQKAEEALRKAEGFRSTAYWYLGTTPGSDSVRQNTYNKNADGPKYLRKMIMENKQFFLSMVSSIGQGAKPDLGDLLGMSGFLSSDPAMSASIADSIFAVKSALRVEGLAAKLPEKASDFKTFSTLFTRPIEKITPGKLGDKPVQEMAEAMRDMLSASLNQFSQGEVDEARYSEIREDAARLKKAVWSVVLGSISESPAVNDTRIAMMGGVLAKNYVNDLMPPAEAVKVVNEMAMKMAVGLINTRLASDENFTKAKDAKEVEQAIFSAEENALKANDDSISKIFALAKNVRIDGTELIAAVVEAKLGKQQAPAGKEQEAQKEVDAALEVDADKKKVKGQAEALDEKKKAGKGAAHDVSEDAPASEEKKKKSKEDVQSKNEEIQGLLVRLAELLDSKKEGGKPGKKPTPDLPQEVQNLAGEIAAANENQVGPA